jgi:hypothetical protein
MAQKYRLNVDPETEHELTEAEVADLEAFGFKVTKVSGSKSAPSSANAEKEKN